MLGANVENLSDKQLIEKINAAIKNFRGDSTNLESAIGALFVGIQTGWKPLFLIHRKSTIKKYEKILDIEFRRIMDEEGPLANKSVAWAAISKVSSFWKAVKGEVPGARSTELKK